MKDETPKYGQFDPNTKTGTGSSPVDNQVMQDGWHGLIEELMDYWTDKKIERGHAKDYEDAIRYRERIIALEELKVQAIQRKLVG